MISKYFLKHLKKHKCLNFSYWPFSTVNINMFWWITVLSISTNIMHCNKFYYYIILNLIIIIYFHQLKKIGIVPVFYPVFLKTNASFNSEQNFFSMQHISTHLCSSSQEIHPSMPSFALWVRNVQKGMMFETWNKKM